jgi:hypothetical protein
MQEDIRQLGEQLSAHEWFWGISTEHDRYIVYADYINSAVEELVPQTYNGKQVLLHFSTNSNIRKLEFTNIPSVLAGSPIEIEEQEILLTEELETLEKRVGSEALQDLLFEVHDGDQALTHLSLKYPDVRDELEILYDRYGFDELYIEIEGF